MGKRDEQREKRYWQILRIALEQFVEKGFYGTSTREIARIADVSSGLMFHYFASKESLYEALVEIGCSRMNLDDQPEEDPLRVFEENVTEIFQMLINDPFFAKMFVFMGSASYHASLISQKAGELLAQHDIIEQSIPLIQRGQDLGCIRSGPPLVLSLAFWCSIQGIAETIARNPGAPVPDVQWILDILKKERNHNTYEPNKENSQLS